MPRWPVYGANVEAMLDFGENITVLKGHRRDQLNVIEEVLRAAAETTTKKTER